MASRFSSTWATELAPVITVETWGLAAHQAIASWAGLQASSSAIASRAGMRALVLGSVSWSRSHS